MNSLDKIYSKSPDIVFRKIANECILVPIRHKVSDLDSIYTLNEVGARIWGLIDGKRTVLEIAGVITEEFEVTRQEAEKNTLHFLRQLETIGAAEIR